jgi:hypothetical protein
VIKAEHDLPGTEGGRGERVGERVRGEEVTQIMYAHVNKKIVTFKGNPSPERQVPDKTSWS